MHNQRQGAKRLPCLSPKAICKCNLQMQWCDLTTSGGTGALSASTISAGVALASVGLEVRVITVISTQASLFKANYFK